MNTKKILLYIIFFLTLATLTISTNAHVLAQPAERVCYLNGQAYPVGAEVGQYACQADGKWKRIQTLQN
jgi:hypothetical protein